MIVGAIMTNVAVFGGDSSVMFTSYPPMQAAPRFYLGLIVVRRRVRSTAGFVFFGTLVVARAELCT